MTSEVIDGVPRPWKSPSIDTLVPGPAPDPMLRRRRIAVVAAMFVVAVIAWGIGFYGLGFYLRELRRAHGWSLQTVTVATMWFYVASIGTGLMVRRLLRGGHVRAVVTLGGLALAVSLAAMGQVDARWQLAGTYLGLALAWSCLNLYPISSVILAWYPTGSGPPLTLALTGASVGGMVMVPLLTGLNERFGFGPSISAVGLAAGLVLVTLAALVVRPAPAAAGVTGSLAGAGPVVGGDQVAGADDLDTTRADDLDATRAVDVAAVAPAAGAPVAGTRIADGSGFWTLAIGFGLALTVQVGFLLHQLSLLEAHLRDGEAARVVAATTVAALVGRLAFGLLAERLDPFRVTLGYLLVQTLALATLASGTSQAWALTATSVAFGLGVGTLVTAPPMLTRLAFPEAPFEVIFFRVNAAAMIGAALGPILTTTLHDNLDGYANTVAALALLDALALGLLAATPRLAGVAAAGGRQPGGTLVRAGGSDR